MKLLSRILALVCGLAIVRAATLIGSWGSQFQKLYAKIDAEIPPVASFLVNTPFDVYLGTGVALGALVAWMIWVMKPQWASLVLSAGVLIGLLLSVWAISNVLMSPLEAMREAGLVSSVIASDIGALG